MYAPNIHIAQEPPMQQAGGFPYGYASPPLQTNEVRQNSGANMADPIAVPDLDDPKEQEKMRKESSEQSESNEAQRKLELIEERLRMVEGLAPVQVVATQPMGQQGNNARGARPQ